MISDDRAVRGVRALVFSARVLLTLTLMIPPIWLLVVIVPPHRVHQLVQRWARLVFVASGCQPRVSGLEHLKGHRCTVMVANHSSYLDSLLLIATIPGDYRFVVNHMAAARPVLGLIIRKSGHLIVDRRSVRLRAACARAMSATLEAGGSLILFPEGTRAPEGLLPFRIGAFRTAAAGGHPVVPIAITGTRDMMPRRLRLLKPGPLEVHVLPPVVSAPGKRHAAALRDYACTAIIGALTTP